MSQTLTVHLERPIVSAKILDKYPAPEGVNSAADTEETLIRDLKAQKAEFSQSCQTLNGVIAKLNEFCDKIFVEHREEIAKLSVEIARKILVQKVQDGDYEIETIVKEALKNAPTCQDVVVHLNPEDNEQCNKALQTDSNNLLSGIRFVSDPNVGRAEYVLESPKGIIKSLINEHLEQIGQALSKAE